MKTTTVKFTYGTVRDAELEVPAEAFSINDAAVLIRKSYLKHAFRPGCGLMSDEVLTSSIGQANFFAGALGGYEMRLPAEAFRILKNCLDSNISMAVTVAEYRSPGLRRKDVLLRAARNEVLNDEEKAILAALAANPGVPFQP